MVECKVKSKVRRKRHTPKDQRVASAALQALPSRKAIVTSADLFMHIHLGNEAAVRRLAGIPHCEDALDKSGSTPLHAAAAEGSVELVKLFLGAQVDPASRNCSGESALAAPVLLGYTEVMQLLLTALKENGSLEQCVNPDRGMPPLRLAVQYGRVASSCLRVRSSKASPIPYPTGPRSWQDMIDLPSEKPVLAIIRLLLDHGAEKGCDAALRYCVALDDVSLVTDLLKLGPRLTSQGVIRSPLDCCVRGTGNLEITSTLLSEGADPREIVCVHYHGGSKRERLLDVAERRHGKESALYTLLRSAAGSDPEPTGVRADLRRWVQGYRPGKPVFEKK
jgi:hypothetical protein